MSDSGYEKKDINLNKIFLTGVIAVVTVIIIIVFILDYFTAVKEELVYKQVLQPASAQLRELRARENEELNSYKLLDPRKGIYRVPIDRAMELIADEAFQKSN